MSNSSDEGPVVEIARIGGWEVYRRYPGGSPVAELPEGKDDLHCVALARDGALHVIAAFERVLAASEWQGRDGDLRVTSGAGAEIVVPAGVMAIFAREAAAFAGDGTSG